MYGAGGQKRVPPEFNKDFRIPVPPLTEQAAIADFLDRKTAETEQLVAKKRVLIEKLQEKRTALISRTVTLGLPPEAIRAGLEPSPKFKGSRAGWPSDIPAHWELLRIATISTKITNGFVGPTRDILVNEGVRYLQSLHIKENRIIFSNDYFVELEWSLDHRKSILREGDVLIVQTGDIGQAAHVTKEFADCNCHALIIVSPHRKRISGKFLSLFLNSAYGFHELKRIQTGALHPHFVLLSRRSPSKAPSPTISSARQQRSMHSRLKSSRP